MGLVDSINQTNDKATDVGEKYIKTSYRYYKLKIFQQLTISVGLVFKALIVGGLGLMCVLLGAVGLALFIGEAKANYPLGFLLVGLMFLVLSLVAYFFRRTIDKLVIKKLSKTFFD